MLHDAHIHLGLSAGLALGPRRGDAQRDARLESFTRAEIALAMRGRAHSFYSAYQMTPPNILDPNAYQLRCYEWKCEFIGGDSIMDMRNMDLGLAQDEPGFDEKVMRRFKEYIILGGCPGCQYDTEQACERSDAAAGNYVEEGDESADGSE